MVNERVGFKDASVREDFFNTAKQLSGGAAWKAFRALFGIGKSQLERYQNGCCLLSCERFEQILSFFSAQKQEHFQNSVFFKSSNWGVVLGGKRTAQLYPEEFAKRRENGLKKIRELEPMKPIELNIPLSVDLCEFIGAVIGDGCIDGHLDKNSNSHYHTFLTGDSLLDNNYLSNHLSSIGKALFTANPRIYFRKGKRAMVLHFFSKNLFTILTKRFGFTAGNKTYTV
ncbi:hypothetical protein KKE06_00410, partial [Candidatus Micrarchaeota archaeon]|nr:hypothetical protein [Candidatus Micrarchaeota archaeon]